MTMEDLSFATTEEEDVGSKIGEYESFRDSFYSRTNIEQSGDMSSKEITLIALMEEEMREYRNIMGFPEEYRTIEERFIYNFQNRRVSKDREGRKEFNEALKRQIEIKEQEAIESIGAGEEGKKYRWI